MPGVLLARPARAAARRPRRRGRGRTRRTAAAARASTSCRRRRATLTRGSALAPDARAGAALPRTAGAWWDRGRRRRYIARTASRSAGGARRALRSASASAGRAEARARPPSGPRTPARRAHDLAERFGHTESHRLRVYRSVGSDRSGFWILPVCPARPHRPGPPRAPAGRAGGRPRPSPRGPRSTPDRARPAARGPGRSSAGSSASRGGCRRPRSGTIGRPASIASRKLPPLNRPTRPVRASRALGEHDERQPLRHQALPALQDAERVGIPPIDEQVPGPAAGASRGTGTVRATPSR